MIIYLDSPDIARMQAARRSLGTLASSWGHEITDTSVGEPAVTGASHDDHKVVDPVALVSMALSIPSSGLVVLDLADRIRKRRRAQELIDHAKDLAGQQVTTRVIARTREIELRSVTPTSFWTFSPKTRQPAEPADVSATRA